MGAQMAQLVERVPHVHGLCPRCSRHRFDSTLWPFAACHLLSLSPISCQSLSCPIKKGTKAKKYYEKKKFSNHFTVCL